MIADHEQLNLFLKATTRAADNRIGEVGKDLFGNLVVKVYVTAVPENGKANQDIITLLAKEWNLRKFDIKILKGLTSSSKQIAIKNPSQKLLDLLIVKNS